jgi:hypothetical protein
VIDARWLEVRDRPLLTGKHVPDGEMCLLEAVSYVAGERWSDHPRCVSKVIGAFGRAWNDQLDDATRQRLREYIPRMIGTATGAADDRARAWLATDWLVRTFTPAWLDLAGLSDDAAGLRALPELTSAASWRTARPTVEAARARAWDAAGAAAGDAAWDAAGAAAWDAAGAAARAAARAAAGDAAGAAAGDAAWAAAGDAAWDAAWAAAGAAAGKALAPTVVALQESAFALFDRMLAVGRAEVPA